VRRLDRRRRVQLAGNVSDRGRATEAKGRIVASRGRNRGTSAGRTALREKDAELSQDGLLLATLRVRIRTKGPWTGSFTRSHPSLTVEVLNRSDLDQDSSVSDHWISGGPPGVWAREISGYSDVRKVDSLAEVADGSVYRITYQNPPVVYLFRDLGLPIQFPLRIQGGVIRWEVVARRSEFESVVQYARTIDPQFQVVSIRRGPLRSHLPMLSHSQHQLLTRAMEAGYFAVPRAITLTNLARQIGRSKSATSEAIAIIERKLLESALRPESIAPQVGRGPGSMEGVL
jgi:predicted DNA binding protein